MDEMTLALLGNKEAQEKFTEQGFWLSCPLCGSEEMKRTGGFSFWFPNCNVRISFPAYIGLSEECLKRFNTRPKILTDEQMKNLEKI